jgi:hypothetical protein
VAEATFKNPEVIAAVNRCATQIQMQALAGHQVVKWRS